MGKNKKWLLLLLIFPLALCSRANTGSGKIEGVLHGVVTDAITKKPLSGVTVSALVPGTNSSREVTTDADGYFRFVQLPASQVTVQFDKKGYQSYKRANIILKEKSAVKLNIECLPEDMDSDADNSNAEYPMLRMMQTSL
ncbi:MAG: carboxypeptidase regulatory-like domain-containing protein [Sphingobacteriales bacterium]|nr:carboxypeptidase regulatory-like domain-containing protein [Sphingobacteriales bacterium]